MNEAAFTEALSLVKIPILTLDQKWHRLFAISGKPDDVKELEKVLDEKLQRQGKLNNDLKDYKKLKNTLMESIRENMKGAERGDDTAEEERKLDENKRLLEELNGKIEAAEDELKDLPRSIYETDKELMMLTMTFCYDKLRQNEHEIVDITEWITKFRIELKQNIIKKQNREINNREIYSYMHDIFGKDVINLFDVRYENADDRKEEADKKEGENKDGQGNENAPRKSVKVLIKGAKLKEPEKKKEDFKTSEE